MKRNRVGIFLITALSMLLFLTACDSNSALTGDSQEDEVALLVDGLASDLGLSGSELTEVKGIVEKHGQGNQEPGFLWNMAAELQQNLTEQQKERLFARLRQHQQGGMGQGHGPQMDPGHGNGPMGDGFLASLLTDEQKEAARAIHESYKELFQALGDAVRDGSLDPADARAQRDLLHEQLRAELDALLTDEQRAALEEHRAEQQVEREQFREATLAVRNAVLGLTEEQIAAWEAAVEALQAEASEIRAGVEAGDYTPAEARNLLQALHEQLVSELASILTDEQLELVKIHAALHWRMHNGRNGMGPGGPGGPGNGGPGGNGMGGPGGPNG